MPNQLTVTYSHAHVMGEPDQGLGHDVGGGISRFLTESKKELVKYIFTLSMEFLEQLPEEKELKLRPGVQEILDQNPSQPKILILLDLKGLM